MPVLKIIHLRYTQVVMILMVLVSCVPGALAQESSQYDKGTPPQHAAGVSPLGSYMSADLGTINLSNGALNIKLPLGSVGGRGFSVPLTLNYSSKVWSASRESNFADETGNHPVAFAQYAEVMNVTDITANVAPGWTIGAAPTLIVRGFGIKDHGTSLCVGDFRFALTKLTVTLPDKGEITLRDDLTEGAPLATQNNPGTNCMSWDGNRGQRWHASDGSGTVFISDSANGIVRGDLNGVLILSDGTRYRFASTFNPPAGSPPLDLMGIVKILARATSITDRNGNVISITYPAANEVRYTDQLGRVTIIQKNVPDPNNPSVNLPFLVTFPGYQGQNRYFKIKSAVMNQRYRPGINPTLPVINGDYDPLGWGLSWGTATRLFPFSHGLDAERIDVMTVLSEFVLPDGRSIEFYYNEFGEVAEVRLPTGGKLQYDYQYVSTLPAGKSHIGEVRTVHFDSNVSDVDRSVVARRTYADGVNLEGTWSYIYKNLTTQVTATSASGSVLLNQKSYFMTSGRYLNSPAGSGPVPDRGTEGTGYSLWSTGISNRIETLDANGTSVMAASEDDLTQRSAVNWAAYTTYAQEQPENDNRVNEKRRYLENGMMAKTEWFYDQYNNPIEVKEYDYNQILKRRTVTTYLSNHNGFNYQTDDSIHLLSLPETTTVFDGGGTQVAQSTKEYDVYTNDGNHGLLGAYGSVSQHDSNYGVSKITRGNVTRIGQWLNTNGTFIYSYPRFDVLGNVVSTKDANGKVTTVSFADDFGPGQNPGSPTQNPATPTYALPTLITSPPPLPGAPVHTARSQYDYSTGLLTGFRDRNDVVTQSIYNDPFNRPTQVKAALGVEGVETHVSNYYAPASVFGITLAKNDVLTASDLNDIDDASIRSWTVTDGFGRTKETWKRDPQGDVKVITVYDCLNRVKQTSNPFRPATESAVYTTTVYDLAGRVTSVTTPDNAVVNTSYSGNTATVTDQAGKARKSVTDALGRLVEVYEDPNGVNWQTTYLYDELDNLIRVTQGSQQRFFMYDSLKRLIRARNPEQATRASLDLSEPITGNNMWSIGYEYDSNGNLIKKTDARGVESIYVYDALNRNTTINYTDTPITTDVEWFYDGATNGKGRFWQVSKGGDLVTAQEVDHTAIDSYDALGRPLIKRQVFKTAGNPNPTTYQIERTYNLAGGVKSQKYPSQRLVTYNYDVAGRLADDGQNLAFTGNLGDGVQRTYATEISYSQWGSLSREKFGTNTPLYHKTFYNIRGQLFDTRLSSVSDMWDWNRGRLILYYSSNHVWGQSGTDNNGNVRFAETWIPPENATLDQADVLMEDSYSYDALNRLSDVTEQRMSAAGGWVWQQQFRQAYSYDRYGNRTIDGTLTWGTGINNKEFAVDTPTNRLYAPGDLGLPENQRQMRYDFAGNLTNDTYTGAGLREYDAENRMTRAWGGNNQSQYYTYNADGQRVRRKVDNQETWQIYGFGGELLAEYAAQGANTSPQKEYGYRNGQLLVIAASSSSGGGQPTSGLVGHWKFDENSGTTAVDASGNGNTGTLSLGATWNTGQSGSAISLDGINDYVQVGPQASLTMSSAVSLSAWIYPTGAGSLAPYGGIIVNKEGEYEIARFTDGTIQWAFANTNPGWNWINTGYVAPLNQWTHVAVTYESGVVKTYINGTLTHTYNGSGLIGDVEPSLNDFRIGGRQVTSHNFHGRIDEVRIYNRALSPVEVATLPNGSQSAQTYTASTDFNNTQGFHNWYYVDENDTLMTYDGVNSVWVGSEGPYQWLWATGGHPGSSHDVVRQWRAPQAGTIHITGSAADTDPGGGDGVVVTIKKGTQILWQQTVANGNTTGVSYDLNTSVQSGDKISFSINRNGDTLWDSTSFNPTITFTPSVGSQLHWLVTDHLGTPRMVIDQTGTLANIKRHDYLPFGEELFAGVGGRTTGLGYASGDGVRQQFTSKERDIETGLDYFGARYVSSIQGRFTGADPAAIKRKHLINPQDLNRYSYVANNPLAFIDPDGEEKIKVIVRTFIPQKTVSMPHPNGGIRTFEGDNRDIGKSGTYRTQQVITIETDPRRNNGSPIYGKPERDTGVTVERGWIWDSTKKASGETLEAAVKRDNNIVNIQAKGDESNPLVMRSPGITYDFMIGIQSEGPKGNVTVTVNGQHDGFPAYEILIVRPETGDNTERVVYGHDPRTTGQTALSLAGGGEFEAKKKCVQKPGGECQ